MLVAALILCPALAHLLFAIAGPALVRVGAKSAGKQVLAHANNLLALCGQLLVFELAVRLIVLQDSVYLILRDSSPELLHAVQILVDPRILSILRIEAAERDVLLLVGPRLIVAFSCKYLHINILPLHEIARVLTDGIHFIITILRLTDQLGTYDLLIVSKTVLRPSTHQRCSNELKLHFYVLN